MRTGRKLLMGNIWKYFLVAVISIWVWSGVFTSLGQIKDNQRLTIGVYNATCDTQQLRNEIAQKLPELTQQEILELYVDDLYHRPNQTYASEVLTAQILQSDLLIMPRSLLDQIDMTIYFPELPVALQSDTDYVANGVHYGILLKAGSLFSKHCEAKEDYFLLLAPNSVNLGGVLEKGEPEDDAALQIVKYLTREGMQ